MDSSYQGSIISNRIKNNKKKIDVVQSQNNMELCKILFYLNKKFLSSVNICPNVNLKFPKKPLIISNEQKEFFKNKIETTKKTELCKNWILLKDCYYKDNCSFAHGEIELRKKKMNSSTKSKKKLCKNFEKKSYCPFGKRCNYLHIVSNHRLIKYKKILENFCEELYTQSFKEETEDLEFYKLIEMTNKSLNSFFLM